MAIRARPEAVRRVRTAFGRYPAWNPFVVQAEGQARQGARLRVRLQLGEGGRLWRMRPRIVRLEPPHALCWRTRLLAPGVLDRRHCFHLEETGPGTRLVQSEELSGALAPLLPRSVYDRALLGFASMNEALKHRVERETRRGAPVPETVEAG